MKWEKLKSGEEILVVKAGVALGFFSRFLGLMGRKGLAKDEAIVFPQCNSIHTFFMRFPIDIVFLDKKGDVIEVLPALRPWRMLFPRRRAKHVIELNAGRAAELGITLGQHLECNGAWD